MKKKYVAPMSALYSLNFTENIASSLNGDLTVGTIAFTNVPVGCRGLFKGIPAAVVDTNPTADWWDYMVEIMGEAPGIQSEIRINCIIPG